MDFDEYLKQHPYEHTRSFTKEDWESSMYERWKEEHDWAKLAEIVKQQDEIIGRLTRENESLENREAARQGWLDKAKKDAGFDRKESFDNVWKVALKAYLKTKEDKDG